jgi:hypothetical protein
VTSGRKARGRKPASRSETPSPVTPPTAAPPLTGHLGRLRQSVKELADVAKQVGMSVDQYVAQLKAEDQAKQQAKAEREAAKEKRLQSDIASLAQAVPGPLLSPRLSPLDEELTAKFAAADPITVVPSTTDWEARYQALEAENGMLRGQIAGMEKQFATLMQSTPQPTVAAEHDHVWVCQICGIPHPSQDAKTGSAGISVSRPTRH